MRKHPAVGIECTYYCSTHRFTEIFMFLKSWAIRGATLGAAIAIAMISLGHLRLFSIPVNDFADRATIKLCPFYILGFSNLLPNMGTLILVTILGNALIYGLLFLIAAIGVTLFQKIIA